MRAVEFMTTLLLVARLRRVTDTKTLLCRRRRDGGATDEDIRHENGARNGQRRAYRCWSPLLPPREWRTSGAATAPGIVDS